MLNFPIFTFNFFIYITDIDTVVRLILKRLTNQYNLDFIYLLACSDIVSLSEEEL